MDSRAGSGAPRRVERIAEVGRRPQHRGVGDEGEAQRLIDLVVEVPGAGSGATSALRQGPDSLRC
jgi:hypothetical protein